MSQSTLNRTRAAADVRPKTLRPPRLPRWSLAALLLGSVAVGVATGLLGRLDSRVQWGMIAAIVFVVARFVLTSAVEGRRQAVDRLAATLVWASFVLAVLPLASLIWETVSRGGPGVDWYFLTHSMNGVLSWQDGGGIYHALLGTLQQVTLASLLAIPVGLLTAVYLVEYGRGKLAKTITFFVDVMTGIPSIVAGLFVLSLWIMMLDLGYSGFAGALALAILMMPIVVRSTEEMLKLVPGELREASLALGIPKWRTILKVVLPTAIGGITTGVMLALARIAGETAPIILLVFGNNMINANVFEGAQSSLPLYVYEQWAYGTESAYDRAWAAALVLIALVMVLNLVARGIARWKAPKTGR
ncbi:phosphate ABC transporter permease PstA [Streptomyces sp. 3MP-14]|uniref:Phosphate transport system permease protein PstA n=1 Tax=Streptomyces mimosae TaxID=2586635 RepID=A0A5N5ZR24_9ACTN|nr:MULTISPECIES: phosphate ABC transporter permease PstA [Streptomyces]KAB8158342.1 phosphate ABC transporter permease PstA [Streptomyces mimosae]KAB8176877.1 phosphate ABC transporter permease PstA [Streptomyces sp. 3MP-14]